MRQPTPLSLSQFFSSLVGKPVNFSLATNAPDPKGQCMYAVYQVSPDASTLVLRIGLKQIGLLGGALLGIPDNDALQRAPSAADEPMRDAMHEVLNIASTAIGGDTRIVFKTMYRDSKTLPQEAATAMKTSTLRCSYNVSVDRTEAELATIFH